MQEGQHYQPQEHPLPSSDHTFCLSKSSDQDAAVVLVPFSPQAFGSADEGSDCSGPAYYKSFPVFNDDGKYFTPSFMLHYDKLVPKPSRANSFCSLCKSCYQDYLEHVTTLHHHQQLASNSFNKEIAKLCLLFTNNAEDGPRKCKTKRIRKAKASSKASAKEMFCSVSTEVEVSPIEE